MGRQVWEVHMQVLLTTSSLLSGGKLQSTIPKEHMPVGVIKMLRFYW